MFEEALEKIHMTMELAIVKRRSQSAQLDEVTREICCNLSAQFGAVIASASAEANEKVMLRWERKETEK